MHTFQFSSAVKSDKGRVRLNNEDNFYFNGKFLSPMERDRTTVLSHVNNSNTLLYGVFDGMGGEEFGEEASLIAAQETDVFGKAIDKNGMNLQITVLDAVQSANDRICKKILDCDGRRIGSTYSLLGICGDSAEVYNVGDSRVYLLRDGKLRQISIDDTSAQRMVNMGLITVDEAKTHKEKHKLTQHLGIFRDELIIEPHISKRIALQDNDVFLLCSDGLTDMVDDADIERVLISCKDSQTTVEELVNVALQNGGRDNVTVMIVRVEKTVTSPRVKFSKIFVLIIFVVMLIASFAVGYTIFENHKNNVAKSDVGLIFIDVPQRIPIGAKGTIRAEVLNDVADFDDIIYNCSDKNVLTIDRKTGFYKAL